MKVIVFGANGQTGQHVVSQALAQGMEVVAFVRRAESMVIRHEHLQVIVGQATRYEDVLAAMHGVDAVISCIGGPGTKVSTTITDITRNVVQAMQASGITRIVQIASAGIHREIPGVIGKVVMNMLKNTLEDHRGAFALLESSGLHYTVARPMSLVEGPYTGIYRESDSGVPKKGARISRADVAGFLLKAVVDDAYIGKSVGLAY
ncbi:MAG: NAD(P)-dependent oxidoreductase [Erysipelotrichaceae bacterium]